MASIMADKVVDCRGLNCPMPVVKTKKALGEVTPGQVIEVTATDPGSKSDIPALVKNMGSEMIETRDEQGGAIVFLIRKK
ncbi:MAG: sulfurtransferase TusA family protein [Nitrospiraceae bacterium]|nr:sulfurtransferase TusA family protein [Nitrospiraceae bacterium]